MACELLTRSAGRESGLKLEKWWKNMMLWTRWSGGVYTCTLTHVHVKHITTHLIERSSALHSCLFAALTLQSSAAVVTPIYNWYPQRGMGCLLCLKGSAQRLRILTTSCPCFRGRDDGGGWLLNRGKTCSHPPYCSHTRWPSEQSNVSHSSTNKIRHNLAKLHLLSGICVDRHQQDSFLPFFHLGIFYYFFSIWLDIRLSDIAFYF